MGFLQRIFGRRNLELKDIARKIGKLMDVSKTESVYRVYVPSRFRVVLAEDDMDRLVPFSSSVNHELIAYIQGYADEQEYQLLSEPKIFFETRDDLKPSYFEIEALYQNEDKEDTTTDQFNTMVFDRLNTTGPIRTHTTKVLETKLIETPILEITDGNDQGMKYSLKNSTVTLGRKEENQVVLHDPNISRFHARLFFNKEWRIEDLNSTNGVFVNGKRIKESPLQTGDQIQMGSTLMKFRIK